MAKEIITIENLKKFKEDADETYQPKGDYATKDDIPDVSGLTEQVATNTKDIEDLKSGEGVDLTDYAKTEDIEDGTIKAGATAGTLTITLDGAEGAAYPTAAFNGSENATANVAGYVASLGYATETYADTAASNAETAAEAYTDANSFNAISASGTRITMTRGDNSTATADVSIDLSGYATTSDLSSYLTTTAAANTYQPIGDYATADDLASYATITAIENGTIKAGSAGSADTAGEASKVTNALTLAGVSGFSYDGSDGSEIPLAGETNGLMSAEDKERLDDVYNAVMTADTLENSSWIAIATAAANGTAKSKWNVGDTKTITLTTGEEITVRIIGFDHDAANSITFEMVDCLNTAYSFNGSNIVTGGWDGSVLRSTLNGAIFNTLPAELQSVIRTVSKKGMNGNSTSSFNTSSDKLFLLSLSEIFSNAALEDTSGTFWEEGIFTAAIVAAYEEEGTQYEWYKQTIGDANPWDWNWAYGSYKDSELYPIEKKRGSSSDVDWWYRSVGLGYSTAFWYFGGGYAASDLDVASSSCGVSFAFCV